MNKRKENSAPPETKRKLDFSISIPFYLNVIANSSSRGASQLYRDQYGIGVNEWRVLATLAVWPDISRTDICEIIAVDKAIASRTVKTLKAKGYVAGRGDESDGRRRILRLTKEGAEIHDKVFDLAMKRQSILLAGFNDSEIKTLTRLLKKMNDNRILLNRFDYTDD